MNRSKRSSRLCPDLVSGWLETRIALTAGVSQTLDAPLGPYLSVISSSPSDGSSLEAAPPQNLVLTFDRAIDPGSIGFSDILLDKVNSDGSLTPIFDPNVGIEEDLDDTGTVLTVPIGQTLTPGNYEVLISAQAFLMGLDGSSPEGVSPTVRDEPGRQFHRDAAGHQYGNQATDLACKLHGRAIKCLATGSFDLSEQPVRRALALQGALCLMA